MPDLSLSQDNPLWPILGMIAAVAYGVYRRYQGEGSTGQLHQVIDRAKSFVANIRGTNSNVSNEQAYVVIPLKMDQEQKPPEEVKPDGKASPMA